MAKAAKSVEIEFTQKLVVGTIKDILEQFDAIDSSRGKHMENARRYREQITAIYERAAAQGIPQIVMKKQIQIERLEEKLLGLYSELENENRKLLEKVLRARGDPRQLALFELPATPPKKRSKPAQKSEPEMPLETQGTA